MIHIGQMNSLLVHEKTKEGYRLKSQSSDDTLEFRINHKDVQLDSVIDVFVYTSGAGKRQATLDEPYAMVGEYAFLRLLHQNHLGSFFDMGLDKDLLVPVSEQKYRMERNEYYIIRVCLDEATGRMYGTTKLDDFIANTEFDIAEKNFVSLMPVEITDLGYKVIINKKYIGMIYHNEIFTEIECAEVYQGVVKKIREDGLIDAALQIQGIANTLSAKDKILDHLKNNNGFSALTDKSRAQDIYKQLGMSKKTFKNALGMLYKERKILLKENGTELISS